jgi:hypothetical protein
MNVQNARNVPAQYLAAANRTALAMMVSDGGGLDLTGEGRGVLKLTRRV